MKTKERKYGRPEPARATQRKRPARKKTSVREYTEAIVVALLAALFLRAFVVQAFRIPTGSMKDTLLIGDFLLVNKFIYGVRTPDGIPYPDPKKKFAGFSYVPIPHTRLPEFKKPRNGDVVVFKFPEDESFDYIKRCIATAGQTYEIRNGEVFVDGQPEGERLELKRDFDVQDQRTVRYTQITTPYGKTYVVRHYDDGYSRSENFGPLVVPRAGEPLRFDSEQINLANRKIRDFYETALRKFEHVNARFRPNEDGNGYTLLIDGQPVQAYTFKQDYYFMMGDNRDNSLDSRAWGFLPEENVVGEALIIYFSWDGMKAGWNLLDSVRWSRIGSLIR